MEEGVSWGSIHRPAINMSCFAQSPGGDLRPNGHLCCSWKLQDSLCWQQWDSWSAHDVSEISGGQGYWALICSKRTAKVSHDQQGLKAFIDISCWVSCSRLSHVFVTGERALKQSLYRGRTVGAWTHLFRPYPVRQRSVLAIMLLQYCHFGSCDSSW